MAVGQAAGWPTGAARCTRALSALWSIASLGRLMRRFEVSAAATQAARRSDEANVLMCRSGAVARPGTARAEQSSSLESAR